MKVTGKHVVWVLVISIVAAAAVVAALVDWSADRPFGSNAVAPFAPPD